MSPPLTVQPDATRREQASGLRSFAHALGDQGAVSAGNFLAIALGAHFLPLDEQAKLVYAFGIYYGLVILNTAAFFGSALQVRGDPVAWPDYERMLLRGQALSAFALAILVPGSLWVAGDLIGWRISPNEALLFGVFLLLQQFADFYRRSGYVFGRTGASVLSSQAVFWIRILGILIIRPDAFTGFLWIFVLSALAGSMGLLLGTRQSRASQPEGHTQLYAHVHLSKWNLVNAPLLWVGLHLPLFMIGALANKEAAAIVGSIRGLTTFMNVFLELLETYIPLWMVRRAAAEGRLSRRPALRLLEIGLVVWVFGLFGLWVAGEQLLFLMLGEAYVSYSIVLLIIWAANGLYFVGKVIALHFRTAHDTFAQVIGSLGGIAALATAVPLITHEGVTGGAWSFFVVQTGLVSALLVYGFARSRDNPV